MNDVFVERFFDPPLRRCERRPMPPSRRSRFVASGIVWRESLLDRSGRRTLCRFGAPSEAAVRDAFRHEGVEVGAVWSGTIHTLPQRCREGAASGGALVAAQHRADEPVAFASLETIENLCRWCLDAHRIRLVRMLLSVDFKRLVYLYRAPDAESVRLAHRQAGFGLDVVWAYEEVPGCAAP